MSSRPEPTKIIESLYIGSIPHSSNKELLNSLKITHILICGSFIEPVYPNDFTYFNIDVDDLPYADIKKHFQEANNFIRNALKEGKILVHCAAGISRSTTCVIAFLMKEYNWNLEKSYKFVLDKHPATCPNFGFISQLKKYESDLI